MLLHENPKTPDLHWPAPDIVAVMRDLRREYPARPSADFPGVLVAATKTTTPDQGCATLLACARELLATSA